MPLDPCQSYQGDRAACGCGATMSRIIDDLKERIAKKERFFSFEYFPPKTDEGVRNLLERQRRMAQLNPAFCDITWGAGGSTADVTLGVASSMQNEVISAAGAGMGGTLLSGFSVA